MLSRRLFEVTICDLKEAIADRRIQGKSREFLEPDDPELRNNYLSKSGLTPAARLADSVV